MLGTPSVKGSYGRSTKGGIDGSTSVAGIYCGGPIEAGYICVNGEIADESSGACAGWNENELKFWNLVSIEKEQWRGRDLRMQVWSV
jgi:hypothetical protein